jgi:hypothetical protein
VVIGDVAADAPVGAATEVGVVAVDRLTLAQASHLIVDDTENAIQLERPEPPDVALSLHVATSVADQNGLRALPGGLQPEIVVDAAISEGHLLAVVLGLEVFARPGNELPCVELEHDRRKERWKSTRGRDCDRKLSIRVFDLADAPVP